MPVRFLPGPFPYPCNRPPGFGRRQSFAATETFGGTNPGHQVYKRGAPSSLRPLARQHAADHRAPRDRADNAVGGGAHGGLETAHPGIGAWTEDAVDLHRGRLTA